MIKGIFNILFHYFLKICNNLPDSLRLLFITLRFVCRKMQRFMTSRRITSLICDMQLNPRTYTQSQSHIWLGIFVVVILVIWK